MRGVIFRFAAPSMYLSPGPFSQHTLETCWFSSRCCGLLQYVLHEKEMMSHLKSGKTSSKNDEIIKPIVI